MRLTDSIIPTPAPFITNDKELKEAVKVAARACFEDMRAGKTANLEKHADDIMSRFFDYSPNLYAVDVQWQISNYVIRLLDGEEPMSFPYARELRDGTIMVSF